MFLAHVVATIEGYVLTLIEGVSLALHCNIVPDVWSMTQPYVYYLADCFRMPTRVFIVIHSLRCDTISH